MARGGPRQAKRRLSAWSARKYDAIDGRLIEARHEKQLVRALVDHNKKCRMKAAAERQRGRESERDRHEAAAIVAMNAAEGYPNLQWSNPVAQAEENRTV